MEASYCSLIGFPFMSRDAAGAPVKLYSRLGVTISSYPRARPSELYGRSGSPTHHDQAIGAAVLPSHVDVPADVDLIPHAGAIELVPNHPPTFVPAPFTTRPHCHIPADGREPRTT